MTENHLSLGAGGGCQFFLFWGYLNTTSLHISCKNFTDLSYVVSFPYISVLGLVAVLKKYLILFALWHGLMNLGWVSLGNIRSFLTTEKSPRHSFLSDFSKPHINWGTRVPASDRKRRPRFPTLTSVMFEWEMCLLLSLAECLNIPIVRIMSALSANYECSSHSF